MLTFSSKTRVFAYPAPCDMRKSFNTLSGLVAGMGHDVMEGDVFAFVSKNRKRAKVLYFDGTGLCLLAKRLSEGQFARLWGHGDDVITLSPNELALLIEGCDVVGRMPLSPAPLDVEHARRIRPTDFK